MHGCKKKTTYHIYNDGVDVSSVIHSIQRVIFCWIFENPTLRCDCVNWSCFH